ncbi:MAG: tryptophan synthase subunit alpha [Actinomycetota bacterium]|nr:tryptophan synthase subunit alpha [Actinomycetota bacterium]
MTDSGAVRLRTLFETVRAEDRAALLPYLTVGIPDADSSASMFEAMAEAGADGFEIGIPYADPLMDGPVIAEAAERSLASGMTIDRALEITSDVVVSTGKPVLLMTYTNPVLYYGTERFARAAADSGAAGLIIADLPIEEADPFLIAASDAGLGMALFAAPTTTDERLAGIVEANPSFVYAVASLGVTGERTEGSAMGPELATRIRSIANVPIVAGVGISTPDQVEAAAKTADGVIVGSALVRRVLQAEMSEDAASSLARAVTDLREAVTRRR